tara:strand:+ start:50 stop:436 length:387 start_codon:yes stop_codon:yes gene_type:complete
MATKKIICYLVIFLLSYNKLHAELFTGNVVELQILDKVTARISTLDILVGESAKFGSLKIEIFHCKKRSPEEIPEDFVLMRIMDEVSLNNFHESFQGWMLSSSSTVSPFEHPTYDVWIKDCKIVKDSE